MLKSLLRGLGTRAAAQAADTAAVNPLLAFAEHGLEGRVMNKWVHYFDVYHRHLSRFRASPATLIEIGIYNGGSLRMWRNYLGPNARVVGVDVNPDCANLAEPGIEIVIGDQGDRGFLRELRSRFPDAAILLDDGGHRMDQQIATFEELYPYLNSEGVYLCEDVHTSYWPQFGGTLGKSGTYIEMVKALIDRLNAAHIPGDTLAPDEFTYGTDSLHFYDSMVVIERRRREAPREGVYGSLSANHAPQRQGMRQ